MISGDLFRSRKILIRMVSFFVARSWHRGRMWKYVKQPHLRKPGQVREISDQKSTQRQRIHLWILKQPKDNGSIYETKINHGKSRVKSPGDLDFGFLEASGETWALGERSAPVSSWMVVSWVGTGMLIVGSTFERLDENNSPSTYIIMYVYIYIWYTYNRHIYIYTYVSIYTWLCPLPSSMFRWHCELTLQGFRSSVEDNSTGNSTTMNGLPLPQAELFFEYNTQNLGSEKKHL